MPGIRSKRPAAALPALAAALFSAACAGSRPAEYTQPAPPAPEVRTVEVANPLLAERIETLDRRSPTFRAGLDSLRATGFQVLITDPADVRRRVSGLATYRARHLGEVLPVRDGTGVLIGAIVTVDVTLLGVIAEEAGMSEQELAEDIDRILVHEVYGHVLPLAWTRDILGGCPDPAPGDPASASCAIVRENRIRDELGMEPRLAYDLRGLMVGEFLEDASAARLARRAADRAAPMGLQR